MARERAAIHKPLSFSTTTRNPNRIVNFLRMVKPYDGEILTTEVVMKVVHSLIKHKIYNPVIIGRIPRLKDILLSDDLFSDEDVKFIIAHSPQNHKEAGFAKGWESRFETFYQLSKEFGYLTYAMGKRIRISQTGNLLIEAFDHEKPDEQMIQNVFLNSMVKYTVNNPFRKNLNDNVPLILLLQVLKKLKLDTEENGKGIFVQEISLFICWPDNDAEALYRLIKKIRKQYGFSYSSNLIYDICLNLLQATQDQTNYFKISQICGEAVDEYIRKMRSTGIISIRGGGRFIDYNSWLESKINYILNTYPVSKHFSSKEEFFEYIGKIDNNIIIIESDETEEENQDVKINALRKFAKLYSKEAIYSELLNLKNRVPTSHDDFIKFIPAPTRFEFLTSIAMVQNFNNIKVIPQYKTDDEGNPTSTASGGTADIICIEKTNEALLEVTLMCGRADQINNEILPIMRHQKEERKNAIDKFDFIFSVLIAPYIHEDTHNAAITWKHLENIDIATYDIDKFVNKLKVSNELIELSH